MFKKTLLGFMIIISIVLGMQKLGYCGDEGSKREYVYNGKVFEEDVIYYSKKKGFLFCKMSKGIRNLREGKYAVFSGGKRLPKIVGDGNIFFVKCVYLGLAQGGKIRVRISKRGYILSPKT